MEASIFIIIRVAFLSRGRLGIGLSYRLSLGLGGWLRDRLSDGLGDWFGFS